MSPRPLPSERYLPPHPDRDHDPYTSPTWMDLGAMAAPDPVTFTEEVQAALGRDRDPAFAGLDDTTLVDEIRTRASEIAAARCAYLDAVAEMVVRGVWAHQGCTSPADWLSWATGVAGSTARSDVLVALRLRDFPHTHEVFARGLLSFSQVRAIVRCRHPEIEVELLRLATYCTGQELERLIGTVTRIQSRVQVDEVDTWERRAVHHRQLDDRRTQLCIDLPTVEALRLRELFDHRADLERKALADARQRALVAGADDEGLAPLPTTTQLTCDLMLEALNAWLADGPVDTTGRQRHTLVLHVDADTLNRAREEDEAVPVWTGGGRHVPAMSASVIRRMLCDASWMAVSETVDGGVVELTGLTRRVPPVLYRLLQNRDRHCRYHGCRSRRSLHAHHIVHVANGGPTSASNLVLLCGHHHRFVHQHDVTIHHDGRGRFRFQLDPDAPPAEPVLALPGAGPDALVRRREASGLAAPPPASTHPDAYGFDLNAAVMVVLQAIGMAQPPERFTTAA